jgi:hypothetical protein
VDDAATVELRDRRGDGSENRHSLTRSDCVSLAEKTRDAATVHASQDRNGSTIFGCREIDEMYAVLQVGCGKSPELCADVHAFHARAKQL